MNRKMVTRIGLLAVSIALAVMGCWFCWNCPMDWLYGEGQHTVFMRQIVWNAMGLVFFAGASMVRWKWWQKSAPWLLVAWALLAFYTVVFGRSINGAHRWVDLGFLRINIRTVFILVSALFAAWLCSKKCVKPWMILALVGVYLAFCGFKVLTNEARLERITSFLDHSKSEYYGAWMHYQLRAAFGAANWFGDAGLSYRLLPNPLNDGMASATALIFGRWFPIVVFGLFAAMGGLLSLIWLRTKDSSKRMFILFWGTGMVFPAVYGLFQCIGFLPVMGCSPVLVGYGGTNVIVFWVGLGALFSLLRDAEEGDVGKWDVVHICAWGGSVATFCLGVVVASAGSDKFYEPRPHRSDFGEFGTQAKRGEIRAADGALLARSYKAVSIHLDPKAAHLEAWESPNECFRDVAESLGLAVSFVSNQYARTNSRFIKLVDEATPEMIGTCSRNIMRRCGGLILTPEQRRDYPMGSNAVYAVGCVRYPIEGETAGCTGLEYTYNATLVGKNGGYEPDMRLSEKLVKGRPDNGGTVETTIVPRLQSALAETLYASTATNGAESGWGIVLKVPTGEIEAMASVPTYNPVKRDMNVYRSYMNNAVQTLFEPGGLMKPITYAMAMDIGLITPKTKIDHGNGIWEYAQTNYHDSCTGELTVAESLIRRSNIAAGKVGVMLWTDRFVRELPRFGIGRKVGGGTLYGEEIGILYRRNKYDPVSISRLGMGRCTAVTGIQMANAYAVFANDGVEVLPHLVSRTTDADGKANFQFLPQISTNRIIAAETAQKIRGMMEDAFKAVVLEAGADLGGVRVAGAVTETAMPEKGVYSSTNYNVAVVGFLPVEKPEHVVAVGFQKPKGDHSVGRVAVPAFAEIVRRIKNK